MRYKQDQVMHTKHQYDAKFDYLKRSRKIADFEDAWDDLKETIEKATIKG